MKIATPRMIGITFQACLTVGPALAQAAFLPPERAYQYEVQRVGSTINIHWHIAWGHYLYKSRLSILLKHAQRDARQRSLSKGAGTQG